MNDEATEVETPPDAPAEPEPQAPNLALFGDNPAAAYRRMQETVEVMKQAFEEHSRIFTQRLVFNEGTDKERSQNHITAEGWTFVGALVGVSARTAWTEYVSGEFEVEEWGDDTTRPPKADGSYYRKKMPVTKHTHGYKALAEAVGPGGKVIGAHEGLCLAAESRWGNSEEYARKSMAQTRAKGQAIGGVLRFLVEMAGYKGTPAEEMTGVIDRQTETRREQPKRETIQAWGPLLAKLDEVGGFTEGVSKGLYGLAVKTAWGIELAKFGDVGERKAEAMARLHEIMWTCQANLNALGVAETETIIDAWAERWPEVDREAFAHPIRVAAGEADTPSPDAGIDEAPGEYP
jgi:hypothetical protein